MKTADGDEGDDGTAEPSDSDRFIGVGEEIDFIYTTQIFCAISKILYNKQNLFKNSIYFLFDLLFSFFSIFMRYIYFIYDLNKVTKTYISIVSRHKSVIHGT